MRCKNCEAALAHENAFCSECGTEVSKRVLRKLEAAAEERWLVNARRLAAARRLPLWVAMLGVLGLAFQLGPAPEALKGARTVALVSNGIVVAAMFAFYMWSRKSPIPAVLSTFAVYAALVVGHLAQLQWHSPGTWFRVLIPLVLLRMLVRGLQGGLAVLAAEVAATAAQCATCGELIPAGKHCSRCGARLGTSSIRPPASLPSVRMLVIAFVACMGLGLLEGFISAFDIETAQLSLLSSGAFAVATCAYAWKQRVELAELFSLRRLRLKHAAFTLGMVGAFMLVLPYFWTLERWGFKFLRYLPAFSASGGLTAAALLYMCALVPLIEETAFRGYTLLQLDRIMSQRDALLVQAVIFAAVHMSPANLPSHFLLGLGLGVLRRRTASLYPSIVAHGAWNAVILVPEAYGF
jgi:membrane protease YdiL (CAAX protease family)